MSTTSCPHCQTPNNITDTFCVNCGWALPVQQISCTRCGAAVSPGARFCGTCGALVEKPGLSVPPLYRIVLVVGCFVLIGFAVFLLRNIAGLNGPTAIGPVNAATATSLPSTLIVTSPLPSDTATPLETSTPTPTPTPSLTAQLGAQVEQYWDKDWPKAIDALRTVACVGADSF